jgi:structural maintenance of chromosome 2
VKKREKEVNEAKAWIAKEGQAAEKNTQEVVKKRDAKTKKGGKLKLLAERVAELAKVLVKIKTQVDLEQDSLQDKEGKIVGLGGGIEEVWRGNIAFG